MEDSGLAAPGKAAAMVRDGTTALHGDIPINASGGLKAHGHPVTATSIGTNYEMYTQIAAKVGSEHDLKCIQTSSPHNVRANCGSVFVATHPGSP